MQGWIVDENSSAYYEWFLFFYVFNKATLGVFGIKEYNPKMPYMHVYFAVYY